MGVRLGSTSSNVIIGSPALAAETIIATTGPLGLAVDNAQVVLLAFIDLTIGTSGTALTLRLRRGTTLTGTQVNVGQAMTVTAGNLVHWSTIDTDQPGIAAGLQYTLTAQVTGGAAASTVSDVSLVAMVL